jgi:hypothetical protein
MNVVVTYNGTKLEIQSDGHGYAHSKYIATLLEGEWPKDDDLVTLCDDHGFEGPDYGDELPTRRHFGGEVHSHGLDGKQKRVKVYED